VRKKKKRIAEGSPCHARGLRKARSFTNSGPSVERRGLGAWSSGLTKKKEGADLKHGLGWGGREKKEPPNQHRKGEREWIFSYQGQDPLKRTVLPTAPKRKWAREGVPYLRIARKRENWGLDRNYQLRKERENTL